MRHPLSSGLGLGAAGLAIPFVHFAQGAANGMPGVFCLAAANAVDRGLRAASNSSDLKLSEPFGLKVLNDRFPHRSDTIGFPLFDQAVFRFNYRLGYCDA